MKRTDLCKKEEKESYDIDLSELYPIKTEKDFCTYKKGETYYVSLPIAMKHCRNGVCQVTEDIKSAAKSAGIPESMYLPKNRRLK